jgi:GNAT superfamily N-acetyltransferase
MNFIVEALNKSHKRDEFDCSEPSLNEFLKNYARQNDSKGLGKTFVAVFADETQVRGFYTLSSGSVHFEKFNENLPRYPIPTVHLGRLAVDKTAKGNNLGGFLLFDAFRRSIKLADGLGIYALEVKALNENAKQFYLKYGFTELKDDEFHLYLPMKLIRKLLE